MHLSSVTAAQPWVTRGASHHQNHASRAEGALRRLDADKSGTLSTAEAAAAREGSRLATGFERIDADGDGQVTRAELTADIRAFRRDGTARAEDKAKSCDCPEPSRPAPESLFEALVKTADKNGDVRLSQDELKANPLTNLVSEHFGTIDGDGDGLLSSREVDAWEDQRKAAAEAPPPAEPADPAPADPAPVATDPVATDPVAGPTDPVEPAPPASGATPPPATSPYTSPEAVSLYESLFRALSDQPGAASVTLGRDVARQFLHLLAEVA